MGWATVFGQYDVGTGALTIANRSSVTAGTGDTEVIGFRSEIGGGVTQAAGRYEATVVFTAITN